MKIVMPTNTHDIYFIQLPNYVDTSNIDQLVNDARYHLPDGVDITSYFLNSDDLTDQERKQLDIYGEIRYPMINIDELEPAH